VLSLPHKKHRGAHCVGIILQREKKASDVPFAHSDAAIVVAGIVNDAGDVASNVYCGAQNPTPMP
jgi:hypothetical protein